MSTRLWRAVPVCLVVWSCCRADLIAQAADRPDSAWIRDAIIYRIIPDRFYNGNTSNDHGTGTARTPSVFSLCHVGGDLEGIISKLDHLKELGVNVLSLTPLFPSNSFLKTDSDDFRSIDPHLGSTVLLERLARESHDRGIRIVLDLHPLYTSTRFFAFQDIIQHGTQSKFRDWYDIIRDPVEIEDPPPYRSWEGRKEFPVLRLSNPDVKDHILSASELWVRNGIDGWLVHDQKEIPTDWWSDWIQRIREVNPDAVIIRRINHDIERALPDHEGDLRLVNLFREEAIRFFIHNSSSASRFDSSLAIIRSTLFDGTVPVHVTQLGDETTERLLSLCSGDDRRVRMAVFFQMTFAGIPMIYFGDEVGMKGENVREATTRYEWDPQFWDTELLAFYRKMINLRRYHSCIRSGTFITLLTDDAQGVYVYERSDPDESIICAINNGDNPASFSVPSSAARMKDEMMGNIFEIRDNTLHVRNMPSRSMLFLVPMD